MTIRDKIKHKKTEPRYTLGDAQVDYIMKCIQQELQACLPKKMTLKEAKEEWSHGNEDNPWKELAGFYNSCLSTIQEALKEKGLWKGGDI